MPGRKKTYTEMAHVVPAVGTVAAEWSKFVQPRLSGLVLAIECGARQAFHGDTVRMHGRRGARHSREDVQRVGSVVPFVNCCARRSQVVLGRDGGFAGGRNRAITATAALEWVPHVGFLQTAKHTRIKGGFKMQVPPATNGNLFLACTKRATEIKSSTYHIAKMSGKCETGRSDPKTFVHSMAYQGQYHFV
jgi:hypothetical protein